MRILQINKYFFSRGGADAVFFETIDGLRKRGHDVSEFAMHHSSNRPSEYAAYFGPALPEKLTVKQDWLASARIFGHLFYSPEIERRLKALCLSAEPQVAHLHNVYHHLSASLFITLRKLGVSTVLTLHDVFPLCPNHSFLLGDHLVEEVFKGKLYNCTVYKCVNNRFLPSLAATLEAYYLKLRDVWKHIDRLICPSQFMYNKMLEWGYPEEQLQLLYNPYQPPEVPLPLGNRIVFLGRIHREKGIKLFLEACRSLRQYPIAIAGGGPEEALVDSFITKNNLAQVDRFKWVEGERWNQVMRSARVIVVPSIFYENCPLAILEALGNGRLVVASDRGGNPEMIINGQTGLLCQPEDADDLTRVLKEAMQLPDAAVIEMAGRGRETILPRYAPGKYFEGLEELYQSLL